MKLLFTFAICLLKLSCKKSGLFYKEERTGRLDRKFRTSGASAANSGHH